MSNKISKIDELIKLQAKLGDDFSKIGAKIAPPPVPTGLTFWQKFGLGAGAAFTADALFAGGQLSSVLTGSLSTSAGKVATSAGNVVGQGIGGVFSGVFGEYWYLILGGIAIFVMYLFMQMFSTPMGRYGGGSARGGSSLNREELILCVLLLIGVSLQLIFLYSVTARVAKNDRE